MEEISCIKDGITGVCRDIKDKKARAEIETLKNTVSSIAGFDGGHLATDIDIMNTNAELSIVKAGVETVKATAENNRTSIINLYSADTKIEQDIRDVKSDVVQLNVDIEQVKSKAGGLKHVATLTTSMSEFTFEKDKLYLISYWTAIPGFSPDCGTVIYQAHSNCNSNINAKAVGDLFWLYYDTNNTSILVTGSIGDMEYCTGEIKIYEVG